MTKIEFLEALQTKLEEELSTVKVTENVQYYRQYITEQAGQGKTEKEVIEMLGDPLLIARTIISTQSGEDYINSTSQESKEAQEEQQSRGFRQFNFKSWKPWLVVVGIVIFLLFLLLIRVVGVLLPIIIPIVLILFVVSFFSRRR